MSNQRVSRRQARERQLRERAQRQRAKAPPPSNVPNVFVTGSFGGGAHFDDNCPMCIALRNSGFESTIIDGATVTTVPEGVTREDLVRMGLIPNVGN